MGIREERLTEDNFNSHSLDNFIRHQVVTECWRNVDGNWLLLPISFVEEWSLESEPFRGMGVGRKLFEKAAGASSVSTQVCAVVVAGSAPVQMSPDM